MKLKDVLTNVALCILLMLTLSVYLLERTTTLELQTEVTLLAEGHNLQRDKIKALEEKHNNLEADVAVLRVSLDNLSKLIPPAPPRTDDGVLKRLNTLERNSDIYYHRFESTDMILTAVGIQIDSFTKKLRDVENRAPSFGPGSLDGVTNNHIKVKGKK